MNGHRTLAAKLAPVLLGLLAARAGADFKDSSPENQRSLPNAASPPLGVQLKPSLPLGGEQKALIPSNLKRGPRDVLPLSLGYLGLREGEPTQRGSTPPGVDGVPGIPLEEPIAPPRSVSASVPMPGPEPSPFAGVVRSSTSMEPSTLVLIAIITTTLLGIGWRQRRA
jgi:hypothetical protein